MNTDVPDTVGFSSSRLDRIRTVMQTYLDQGKLPGAVTMIARRGQVVHAECFGMSDIEARKPMQITFHYGDTMLYLALCFAIESGMKAERDAARCSTSEE